MRGEKRTAASGRGLQVIAGLLAMAASAAFGGDADWYSKQANWEETVRLSRENIAKYEEALTVPTEQKAKQKFNEGKQERRRQVWALAKRDFPELKRSFEGSDPHGIFGGEWKAGDFKELANRYARNCRGAMQKEAQTIAAAAAGPADLDKVRVLYRKSVACDKLAQEFERVNLEAAQLAIEDMATTWAGKYDGAKHKQALEKFAAERKEITDGLKSGKVELLEKGKELLGGVRAALLANPLLDFGQLALIKREFPGSARNVMSEGIGLHANYMTNDSIRHNGWDNEIAVLSDIRGEAKWTTLYKPQKDFVIRDMDVDFDGKHVLFASIDDKDRWGVFQVGSEGGETRQLSPKGYPDVDWFDGCYLPDGRLIVASTAPYQGLPCINGGAPMAVLYQVDPAGGSVKQLTFEQDSDWYPTAMNDGRVMYLRWEYSDIMHYYSRILFSMNPDGTQQMAIYGSGSYFPTAFMQAKAIPGSTHKVVGIVGGHHDVAEQGRMIIIDPELSGKYPFRYRAKTKEWGKEGTSIRMMTDVLPAGKTGCVAEIPGRGKDVEGDVCDGQAGNQFSRGKPFFLHPWPLSDKYFLVTAKPTGNSLWGVYLVDTFDNITCLAELEDAALLQPIPLAARKRPPSIQDRTNPSAKTASVHIADIYEGPGLTGVPRGKVKSVRVFAYHFCYLGTGGHESLGVEAGWDIKRILGTAPVESDGSTCFEIPINTPVSIQPLDEEGAALQLMRSWIVGMPGERISCTGCHEDNRSAVPTRRSIADATAPQKLKPWYGPARPFAFEFEVYPTTQKFCGGCHNGAAPAGTEAGASVKKLLPMTNAKQAYDSIHPYVRRPGPESELEILPPMDWHTSTSPLVQMLKKGHYGVKLDAEGWDRLYTWIDLNAPFKGRWGPGNWRNQPQAKRRYELAASFAASDACPEDEYARTEAEYKKATPPAFVKPEPLPAGTEAGATALKADGFPFTAEQAAAKQKELGEIKKELKLAEGVVVSLVKIPAGSFVMGSLDGYLDEKPQAVVKIEKPFWMSETEITNAQYAVFDPEHDTRYVDMHGKDHAVPGYIANHPNQPVARVTWQRAMDFCKWMGKQNSLKANLPTEAQWEWAARAGSSGKFFYGDLNTDYSKWANLAGRETRWNYLTFNGGSAIQKRNPYKPEMNYPLHDERFEDKWFVVDYVAQYEANAWGLKDMIGNVSEWTRSQYKAYPYSDADGRNDEGGTAQRVARGGSWADRPVDATSSIRRAYESWQKVHDVGFRVIVEE
ncbi:MAG TPA: SUMF1/EgtB/PvdO family nonheme iron enzyme [Planctomycetota bacterium]|jgi:formylglycine-generating enzyme required for sulfatase activity